MGRDPTRPENRRHRRGFVQTQAAPEIRGTGYVVDTLEAILWAFFHTEDFREGALKVVNLGNDADTTGAIYGQIAGAHYGVAAIPAVWRDKLAMAAKIMSLSDYLHDQAAGT